MAETIIKYNRPKDYKNRGGDINTTIINNGGGDTIDYNFDSLIQENILWKKSNGVFALVPKESYNEANGDNSVAIGTYTETTNEGELAIGTYNDSIEGKTLFTIGDGTDEQHRHNVIQVSPKQTIINNNLSATTVASDLITADEADITTLSGDSIFLDSGLTTVNLEAISGTIETLLSTNITVDNLTVTKAAHFFKLIIDEVKATQGQIIITPANAVIDKVTTFTNYYRCYYRATDGDGREISNSFERNDQIVCQTFNAATGTSYNVSNTYYWALCINTGSTNVLIDGQSHPCHYVDISRTDKDPNSISTPQKGDNIVMLGNRTNTARQSAIILSAYENQYLDPQIKAPSMVQYYGINDYNLATHRHNVLSRDFNQFKGDFTTTAGDDIGTTISNLTVNVNGINTRVTNIEGDYVNSSQLTQTANEIRAEVQQEIANIKFEKIETVDATSLDPNKCYPVTISFNQSNDPKQIRCAVSRTLVDGYGVPNYSTHSRGFVLDLDWTTRASGWGTNWVERYWSTNDKTRFIQEFEVHHTDNTDKVVGSIGQVVELSIEVVYVRGGSKYDILTSFKDATITLHPTGYKLEIQEYSVLDERPVINYSDLVVPVKDRMARSEIIQTADNIQLNVYNELNNKTGIDVSTGQITLNADNTTIVGNLNITDTENGITVFDSDGIGRIYLQPDSINDRKTKVFGDKFDYYTTHKEDTGHTTWNCDFNNLSLFSLPKDKCIQIGYIYLNVYALDSNDNLYVPPANIVTEEDEPVIGLKLELYRDNTLVKTYNLLKCKYLSDGFYIYDERITYTTTASGNYSIKLSVISYMGSIQNSYRVYRTADVKVQWGEKVETYLGCNGLYAHSAPNKYFWLNEEQLVLRNEGGGIRFGLNNNGKGFDVLTDGDYVDYPQWLPFHNYTPTFGVGDRNRPYVRGNITNIGETKYYYQIDPLNDYGVCIVSNAAPQAGETVYILLPPISWKVTDDGVNHFLPIGYTITIVNNLPSNQNTSIIICPSTTTYRGGRIVDSDGRLYYSLSISGSSFDEPWKNTITAKLMYLGATNSGEMRWLITS